MDDIDQKIKDEVQKELDKKEAKEKLGGRFASAIIVGLLFGYIIFSKLWIFSFYENMLFWAIAIGAIVGFFLREIFILAIIGIILFIAYSWFHDYEEKQKPDTYSNYMLCVANDFPTSVNVKIGAGYMAKDKNILGNYSYNFDLDANKSTHLTHDGKSDAFGAVRSVEIDNGKYRISPDTPIRISESSTIKIGYSGIIIVSDPDCK